MNFYCPDCLKEFYLEEEEEAVACPFCNSEDIEEIEVEDDIEEDDIDDDDAERYPSRRLPLSASSSSSVIVVNVLVPARAIDWRVCRVLLRHGTANSAGVIFLRVTRLL